MKKKSVKLYPGFEKLREEAYGYLSPKRVSHVAGCESAAVRLAEIWGEDAEKAAMAGILHDVTKRLSYEEQLQLIEKYAIVCDGELLDSPKLLHAVTGAALAEKVFSAPEDVCSAIRWHTTGRPGMTALEKIIYLADFIEPTRDFDGVEELRRETEKDLDSAMALGLRMSLEEIQARGEKPYSLTADAYEYYSSLHSD